MAPTDDIRQELDEMKDAIGVLTDGKWDKRDVAAIATMLSSAAGLLLAVLAILMQIGVIGGSDAPSEPDPVEEASSSSSDS